MGQPQTLLSPSCALLMKNQPLEAIFEAMVGRAVDDTLSALGDSPKQAIYRHLKIVYGINKEDIPNKIDAFANAIEQTFGSVAKLIEIKIIENLHSEYEDFCHVPKNNELNFVEYITDLQSRLEQKTETLPSQFVFGKS
jgi:hypothetical protein